MNSKVIDGFNYSIYENGSVTRFLNAKAITISLDECRPYPYVSLRKDGKTYKKMVHVLLATAFIPNPHGLPEVNHKDGNKLNYSLDNLEWCTNLHNINHAFNTGLNFNPSGENARRAILTQNQVDDIRVRVAKGERQTRLAIEYGVHRTTIGKIIRGRNWK